MVHVMGGEGSECSGGDHLAMQMGQIHTAPETYSILCVNYISINLRGGRVKF